MPKKNLQLEFDHIKNEYSRFKSFKDEDLFSLVCLKYFYYSNNFSFTSYKDCFVDGKNDGGIDLIVINDNDSYSTTLSLIQCKYYSSLNNKQDIVDIFTKIEQTYSNFLNNKTTQYNSRLKRVFKDKLNEIDDIDNTLEFVLFISVDITELRKQEIKMAIDKVNSLKDYSIVTYYLNDINNQIEIINNPKRFVEEGQIQIKHTDGILRFGDNGALVNISANSLRDIYDRFKDHGLFEQNFRYYIRNKKIDDNINNSLKKRRDGFWFLNNGIIISCKEFIIDGDNVKLFDFSIVNGCQTTTLIGDYKGKNDYKDFVLPCKIVKSRNESNEAEFSKFMSDIAEASNSQKPISDRDLKANRPEQRALQTMLRKDKPMIYLEIKRGEKQRKSLDPWQKIKNDDLGQLILSFNLQQPGTARSGKRKIFSIEKTYRSVFMRNHSKENIIDLLKLKEYYISYVDQQLKKDIFTDLDQESVARNGKYIILALIGFLIKQKNKLIDLRLFSSDDWKNNIEEDNLTDFIFNNEDPNFELNLNSLFQLLIIELSDLYRSREKEEKNVSNFFKTDTKYRTIILKYFIDRILNNAYKMNELKTYMSVFN